MTDDLQSWSEVPRIAHFCSLFRKAFDLLEFDIQDLEEGLLLLEDEERLVPQLLVKLLKGCSRTFTKVVKEDNYNKYLRRLFISKAEEAEEDEIDYDFECEEFTERNVNFEDLSLRNRVRILHQLCEFRLDGEDVSDKVKNLEASSLRVEPLGKDSEGYTYWYFYGTRLYKEAGPSSLFSSEDKKKRKEKDKKKRKKKEKKKRKKKNSHSSSEDDNNPIESTPLLPTWSVACLTLQDWIDLTEKMRHSKKKFDKDLYLTLSDNFLPEIIKMFADKEREERRRLRLLAPKRTSSRIERKKRVEQEEKDRVLAEKLEEERRIQEEYEGRLFGDRGKRRRGRSRKSDELAASDRNRSERMRQREQMKELREKKIAEKEVAKAFPREVETQKKNQVSKKREREVDDDDDDLSDVSVEPKGKKGRKSSSSGRRMSEDEEEEEKEEEEEEEEEEIEDDYKDKKNRSKNNKSLSNKASSKSSPSSKKESRKRKRGRPSLNSSKKRKRREVDSSSNEDDDLDDESCYSDASEEEPPKSESSSEEERQIKDLIKEEAENEVEEKDEDDEDSPKVSKTSTFANALLKVGTKSTRDSNLDKSVRKSPGRLLQTAGLQKSGTSYSSSSKIMMNQNGDRLNGGGALNSEKNAENPDEEQHDDEDEEPKISFSLYGGHLPVDIGGFTKSSPDASSGENRLSGLSSSSGGTGLAKKDEPQSPVRKVFSNWGGEFFKKNLDYRANTNKILEKMNLTSGNAGPVSSSSINTSHPRKEFLSPFKKTLNNQSGSNTPSSDEKKPSIKTFLGCS